MTLRIFPLIFLVGALLIVILVSPPRPTDAVVQQIYSLPFYDSFYVSGEGCFGCYPGHEGIDYQLGVINQPGERAVAAFSGTAKPCGPSQSAGWYVVMSHHDWGAPQHITRYLHLNGPAPLLDGAGVARGQTVGYEGDTGDVRPAGTDMLHFETRHGATSFTSDRDGTAVDPNLQYTTNPPSYAAGRCYYPLDSRNPGNLPGVYRPQPNGTWWHENFNFDGTTDRPPFTFAMTCDIPVVGDWDGNGVETPGIYRPNVHQWHISNNPNGSGVTVYQFGTPGDWPVVGDWNGDRATTIGVWRPSDSTWHLRNANHTDAGMVPPFAFGILGQDKPVVGDWDGDMDTNIGVFREAGQWWHLRAFNNWGPPTTTPFQYGQPGDYPITGDWNFDIRDTVGVFRAGTSPDLEWHLRNLNSNGPPTIPPFAYGVISDKPISGDWN